MALINCPECKKKVSETVSACPHCGFALTKEKVQQIKNTQNTAGAVGCLVIVVILVLFSLSKCGGSNDADKPQSSTSSSTDQTISMTQSYRISSDSYFGCTDRDEFSKIVGFAVSKDQKAFGDELAVQTLSGGCIPFATGDEVFVTDTAIFSGLVQVRKKGETESYWTNIEAIKH